MNTMNEIKSARNFIDNLAIPDRNEMLSLFSRFGVAPSESAIEQQDYKETAQVNAGSLISFTDKLSGVQKSDVQNSTLLAQLHADHVADRYKDPVSWYKKYVTVLEKVGWNLSSFAFDEYTSSDLTISLDKVVLEIVSAIASMNEIAILKATLGALSSLGDDSKPMKIWDSNSRNERNGNFQIMPVDIGNDGSIVMILSCLYFYSQDSRSRFLWFTWGSNDISINANAHRVVLNESVYSQVRDNVVEKLGLNAKDFVSTLEI
ncbi:hypothetical protein R5P12_003512 [Klebsiella aerogenes]|nr:hypothetical protein [Klebsiella aerogenes]HEO1675206.1 hypothetical protein [Klebsiella aerogenes]